MKEEAERRNQRLQELYRRQREVAKTVTPTPEATVAPVQKRLQETYNKLLLEEVHLGEETSETHVAPSIQMVLCHSVMHYHIYIKGILGTVFFYISFKLVVNKCSFTETNVPAFRRI